MGINILVTGAAGFIGRHVVELAVERGHRVVAVDCFLPDSYDPGTKRASWDLLGSLPNVIRHELDLRAGVPADILEGINVVINEAAMPGLSKSWEDFDLYSSCNTLLVSNLVEASLAAGVPYFIQASTSSVYGLEAITNEDGATAPISPYGVTKLAAEHLLLAYAKTSPIEVCILRYFSVFGPGQRPDMAYHRFIRAILTDEPLEIYGDGSQSRTNTYVTDIADATITAAEVQPDTVVMNVAGGEERTLLDAISELERITGRSANCVFLDNAKGDQRRTVGDTTLAASLLGFTPTIGLSEGLADQVDWQSSLYAPRPPDSLDPRPS